MSAKEYTPKPPWRCSHCHAKSKHVACTTCNRDMCDECISDDPEVGPVCGLCYDRKYHPEPDPEYGGEGGVDG